MLQTVTLYIPDYQHYTVIYPIEKTLLAKIQCCAFLDSNVKPSLNPQYKVVHDFD